MSAAPSLATAVAFVWLGMVLAISFLETPLKFRAPGVTIPMGLGIGRLVFRALNGVELILAAVLGIAVAADLPATRVVVCAAFAIVVLLAQVGLVRPALSRLTNRVLAGGDAQRSRGHYWYVALEVTKVVALLATGVLLLMS